MKIYSCLKASSMPGLIVSIILLCTVISVVVTKVKSNNALPVTNGAISSYLINNNLTSDSQNLTITTTTTESYHNLSNVEIEPQQSSFIQRYLSPIANSRTLSTIIVVLIRGGFYAMAVGGLMLFVGILSKVICLMTAICGVVNDSKNKEEISVSAEMVYDALEKYKRLENS